MASSSGFLAPSSSGMNTSSGPSRRATHAGSWYTDNGRELARCLDAWLAAVRLQHAPARAIIAPHAGYTYCGATAAHAYKQVDPCSVHRVFVLGPSHHVCLAGCALTKCAKYETPLGDLAIDQGVNAELLSTGAFDTMDMSTDEAEHSIEMHLPYLARILGRRRPEVSIVPILVGSLSPARQSSYGRILAPYLAEPTNLFVVSSDFCHWGSRFHFTPYERSSHKEIHQYIEDMDRTGMSIIESLDPGAFNEYLKRTQNTICGRHPISVMLQAAEHFRQMNNHKAELRFLHYSQSNRCRSAQDSSVSYAAGALKIMHK